MFCRQIEAGGHGKQERGDDTVINAPVESDGILDENGIPEMFRRCGGKKHLQRNDRSHGKEDFKNVFRMIEKAVCGKKNEKCQRRNQQREHGELFIEQFIGKIVGGKAAGKHISRGVRKDCLQISRRAERRLVSCNIPDDREEKNRRRKEEKPVEDKFSFDKADRKIAQRKGYEERFQIFLRKENQRAGEKDNGKDDSVTIEKRNAENENGIKKYKRIRVEKQRNGIVYFLFRQSHAILMIRRGGEKRSGSTEGDAAERQ